MRILYLHQYFVTRAGIGGTRSYEFARYLVSHGHRVTILTAANDQKDLDGLITRKQIDGIDVVLIKAGYADYVHGTTLSYLTRIIAFLKFAFASSLAVIRVEKPQVVFATSPPLTIGIPALLASKLYRVPLVFEVRDLWPEAPIQLRALRNRLGIALARFFERMIYRQSAHVIALSPGIRDGVVATSFENHVSVIPNAADLELFSPELDGREFRARWGINGQFVCTYFGTMGEANDLMQVVEAARLLQQRGVLDVAFVLHGAGKRRAMLERFCREQGLKNVIFSDPIADKHAIARLAAASDTCMTIYKNLPVLYTCSPNKLFDTFAAGRPAIVNSPGWLKELVEGNEAGLFARPDDPEHLAECILYLRDNPKIAKDYGQNARQLAERSFDRNKLAGQLLSIIEKVAGNR